MDILSYILSVAYVKKSLDGVGALKGAPCTISGIVDNPDGTHDITFSWKDNQDPPQTHTSILTVANGETPTITSTEIEGGHTITFATTNPLQSVSFNVMDGEEGQRGVSVIRADVDNNNYLKLELSDGNIINAGQIKTISMVDNMLSLESANPVENRVITSALNDKVNKVSGKQLSTEDFTTAEKNKLANVENGAQVNTLENLIINGEEATIVDKKIALNIITSAVSNLQNYYLKSETYTKTEVEELIGSTVGVTIEIVQELPTVGQTNVIYFLPTETANVYSQYIYTANDGWVLIGSTSVDLSNYYTKGQVDTLLNGKQNVLTIDAFPTAMSNNPVASGGVYSAIAQMQPQFQFTNMPVASQSNYGFVYQYVGNAGTYEPNMFYRCVYNTYAGEYRWEEVIFHATVTVDSELSSSSTNPVQNKVVKAALDTKQDIMQFSTMPSAQDNLGKIVQYTGATTATYQNACFYKAVYDSEHDTYVWTMVKFSADISVDNVLSDVSENPVQNKVITNKFGYYKPTFTGTEEEWNALTSEQQNAYDIVNITNDGDVLNLGVYLEKKTAMPVASEDVENKIYLYTGTTTQNYKKGVVYQCVSDGQDPATYSWVALIDFGTASIKNSTDRVSPNNTDLVESQSVYSAINTALSSIYTPRGDITCAELTSSLLIAANVGNIYEVSDSGTTTALFLQGAGHPIAIGDNVGIINAGQDRILFNLMANAFDLTNYQKIDLTQAVEGATTVEGALGALSTDKQPKDLTTAVESATTVEGALGALSDNKQAKTLTTSVESQTTVEGALSALSTNKATQTSLNTEIRTRAELGAHNLLKLPYYDGWEKTQSGVTFRVNADGSVTVSTENGGATGETYFYLRYFQSAGTTSPTIREENPYIGKRVTLSGCPSDASTSKYYIRFSNVNPTEGNVNLTTEERTFDVTDRTSDNVNVSLRIIILEGQIITTPITFYPMIRLASDADPTYQPYAMTNQQITNIIPSNTTSLNNLINKSGLNDYMWQNRTRSNDVLADALNISTPTILEGSGTSYTGTVPYSALKYATFLVIPRGGDRFVIGWINGAIVVNNYNSTVWNGWTLHEQTTSSVTSGSTQPITSGAVYDVTTISAVTASNFITLESGYSLPDFVAWKQGNRVWGYGVISTTGSFNRSQGKIGEIKTGYKPNNVAINSVCFISNNRYGGGAFDVGYFWIDSGQVLIGNPSGDDTKNYAKFSFDYCFE